MLLFMMCLTSAVPAYATGSGNVDGGGGSLNHGKDGYYWPDIGYDGVRVTVVDAQSGQRVSVPVDYTNVDVGTLSPDICHFGKVSKVDYRNGAGLSPQVGGYVCRRPAAPIPQIISGNSRKASIPVIRQYFCSEAAAVMVANDTGIPFEDIEEGKYKLVIEPIIYLVYQHLYFAMTTTEAGLYNQMTDGDLGSHFPTVVMKNHALALFLERSDLGFAAWTGPTGSARTTQEMISILGIGIISYQKAPETIIDYDKEDAYAKGRQLEMWITLDVEENQCILEYNPNCPWYRTMGSYSIDLDKGLENVRRLLEYGQEQGITDFNRLLAVYHNSTGLGEKLEDARGNMRLSEYLDSPQAEEQRRRYREMLEQEEPENGEEEMER